MGEKEVDPGAHSQGIHRAESHGLHLDHLDLSIEDRLASFSCRLHSVEVGALLAIKDRLGYQMAYKCCFAKVLKPFLKFISCNNNI
jgi:hypothetical protein